MCLDSVIAFFSTLVKGDALVDGHELAAHLLQTEQLSRQQEKTAYYLRLAKLRLPAIPEQVTCSASRNLTKQQLATLLQGQYLDLYCLKALLSAA